MFNFNTECLSILFFLDLGTSDDSSLSDSVVQDEGKVFAYFFESTFFLLSFSLV